jgi:hypothetical protein
MKEVLEDDALIRAGDFSKGADTNYFHRIDVRHLDIAAIEAELNLVWSSVSIPLSGEGERTIRDRNAHQNEGSIRKCGREGGDLSDEAYGTRSGNEPDLPIEFADIRSNGSGWGECPRIRLGVDIRTRGTAPTHDSGSEKKQPQAGSGKNQHERLIPYPVLGVSITFATCPENKWSAHRSLTMPSGKR